MPSCWSISYSGSSMCRNDRALRKLADRVRVPTSPLPARVKVETEGRSQFAYTRSKSSSRNQQEQEAIRAAAEAGSKFGENM